MISATLLAIGLRLKPSVWEDGSVVDQVVVEETAGVWVSETDQDEAQGERDRDPEVGIIPPRT